MKTKLRLLIAFVGITFIASAQYNFVVQNNSTSVFKTIDEAFTNAESGDTIYLPGGSFNMPAIVDKSLVLIGVGYNPDSTLATYNTRINNGVSFTGNCDNTFVTGIYFSSDVNIGSNGNNATDFKLFRCRVGGSLQLKYANNVDSIINSHISQCIIDGSIDANLGSNIIIDHCVIRGIIVDARNSYFDFNIFSLGSYSFGSGIAFAFNNTQECLVRNSIFNYNRYSAWRIDFASCIDNKLLNNIFAGSILLNNGTNIMDTTNVGSVNLTTVFENIDGVLQDFSYQHDFHIKAGSPASSKATDGTDLGIYGGQKPFKVGGLPSNPHIRKVEIGDETSNGLLPVSITVGAQNE